MAILCSAFESYLPFIVGFTGQLLESILLILALSSGVGIGWKRSACGLVISQISADSKRFGNEMTSAQGIAGNRSNYAESQTRLELGATKRWVVKIPSLARNSYVCLQK